MTSRLAPNDASANWAVTVRPSASVNVTPRIPEGLASVTGRMRWKWLLLCLGLSVIALFATLVVSSFIPAGTDSATVGDSLNDWTPEVRNFLLVILLLTPLQAAGEPGVSRCGGSSRPAYHAGITAT